MRRVAAGEAEGCVTSVTHALTAHADDGPLPARFAAVVGQRSPMAGLVAAGSPLAAPTDLGGRRVAAPADGRLLAEYRAGLAELGVAGPVLVERSYADAPAALARGEAEVVPDFADLVPRVRRQAGLDVRPVRLGIEVYSSGLVVGDHLPAAVVDRLRAAVVEALEHQRRTPAAGLDALCDRYPGTDPADAAEGWRLAEPSIFADAPVGSMGPARWQRTIDRCAGVHGLPAPPVERVVRPELLTAAPARG